MCGTCAGVCPVSAITMKLTEKGVYAPTLQPSLCTQCGRCIQACPGLGIKVNTIKSTLFQAKSIKFRRDIGNYIGCYYGHAIDPEIRQNSTSSGAVTALLTYLLENKIIQGALVTKSNSKNPLETESFIARSIEDVQTASTTRYCPTAPNTVLSQILRENGVFAVVGLPCHIHGIRKAERMYPTLKSKILLHMGLFCSGVPTFTGTYELLYHLGLTIPCIKEFKYRIGWPSTSLITLETGNIIAKRFRETLLGKTWGLRFFNSPRCLLCFDALNELADISFGDAYLPRTDDSNVFRSLMITRTPYADAVLRQARIRIHIKELPPSIAAQTQRGSLRFKAKVKARINIRQFLNKAVPQYDIEHASPTPIDYGKSLVYYLNVTCGSKRHLKKYVPYIAKIEKLISPLL
jgi:coenzyme F420 hydrogenase subunit beta